ncbi:hypothetical protein, partial [Rathayibacter sp. AY2B7]|uniref:hypothetical protein n=1 Tax=Rathayibacter sp. AY2B7 TaxID=2080571 RepID=UPI001CA5140D
MRVHERAVRHGRLRRRSGVRTVVVGIAAVVGRDVEQDVDVVERVVADAERVALRGVVVGA